MKKTLIALAVIAAASAVNAQQYQDANTAAFMRSQAEYREVVNADNARRTADALESIARSVR